MAINTKQQNNTPKLRFPGFSDPWEENKLGGLCEIKGRIGYRGYTVNDIVKKGEGVIAISPSNINNGQLNLANSTYISWFKYNESPEIKLELKDILLVKTGSTYGKSAYVKILNEPATINPQLVILKKIKINPLFLSYVVFHPIVQRQIHATVVGGAIPTLTQECISSFKILSPALPEQKKIADFLGTVDEWIAKLKAQKQGLDAYKKGLMQRIFSQEIRFKDDKGKNFQGWEEKKLGEVVDIKKGKQLNRSGLSKDTGFPVINGGIEPSGYTRVFNMKGNTITISEGGNSCGFVNLIEEDFWCGGHCYSLLNLKSNFDLIFLYQYLKSLEKKIMRLRVGSGLPNIQMKDINKLKLYFPELPEQQKIANFLTSIDNLINLKQQQITRAEEWKKGVMIGVFV